MSAKFEFLSSYSHNSGGSNNYNPGGSNNYNPGGSNSYNPGGFNSENPGSCPRSYFGNNGRKRRSPELNWSSGSSSNNRPEYENNNNHGNNNNNYQRSCQSDRDCIISEKCCRNNFGRMSCQPAITLHY